MVPTTLVITMLVLHAVVIWSGDYIPDRKCATLYSAVNFEGESLELKDFDQSVNLKRDYRRSLNGWQKTGSLRVEMNCSLAMCTTTYVLDKCRMYFGTNSGDVSSYNYRSASCTCKRECDCAKLKIPLDNYVYGDQGRVYFNQEGCNICDSEYVRIPNISPTSDYLSEVDRKRIEVIVMPVECILKIYRSDKPNIPSHEKPIIIKGPYAKFNMTNKRFGYYEITCNTSEPSTPINGNSTLNEFQIPGDKDSLFNLLLTNATLRNDPALIASLKSTGNRRSSKNAYVIFIGEPRLFFYGFPWCKSGNVNKIWACHIPVWINDLRITAEVRVIAVSIDEKSNIPKLTADLDEYLTSHEELRNVIPNAVIVRGSAQRQLSTKSWFLRRLVAVKALKASLVDERYPNLVFFLDYWEPKDTRTTQETVDLVETEVHKYIQLPNSLYPIGLCLRPFTTWKDLLVTGYFKKANGQYWPKSMEDIILNNCKNGDPLGYSIFKSAFHDNRSPRYTIDPIYSTLSANKTKVEYYEKYFSDHNLFTKNAGKSIQYNEEDICMCPDFATEINGLPEDLFDSNDPICRCKSD